MLSRLRESLRRALRGVRRRAWHPLLLPHFQVRNGGLSELGRQVEVLPPGVAEALARCDGWRTLSEVAREAGVAKSDVIRQHEAGRIALWPYAPGHKEEGVGVVIVSPHPDDAALSACAVLPGAYGPDGGVSMEGVLVLDVFSRTGWWRFSDRLDELERIQQVREAEERLLERLGGVRVSMLGLPEALLRGYAMETVFAAEVKQEDAAVAGRIAGAVVESARANPEAKWLLPLAVGGHVDHRVARDAALGALEAEGVGRDRVRFYEDQPYAAALGGVPDFSNHVAGRKLRPARCGLRRIPVAAKRELLRVYWSQLTASQIRQVEEYARRLRRWAPAERYWEIDE